EWTSDLVELKPGTRLKSQVCDTQVVVVRASDAPADLRCGGAPMVPFDTQVDANLTLAPTLSTGSLVGKRYVAASGLEVLCTKAGAGTVTVGSEPLDVKSATPLPASD
ncbi:MAG: hypothetical protein QOJ66_2524, partial [Ilumatobacteraceae bacterium]